MLAYATDATKVTEWTDWNALLLVLTFKKSSTIHSHIWSSILERKCLETSLLPAVKVWVWLNIYINNQYCYNMLHDNLEVERKIKCNFIFLISLSYKKFILSLIKILVLFSTPLVMLSTKNKDPMMNYVITNNPKMLI